MDDVQVRTFQSKGQGLNNSSTVYLFLNQTREQKHTSDGEQGMRRE